MAGKKGSGCIPIDPEQVEELARIGCTIEEIAGVFKCSRDTIEKRFRDEIDAGKADMKKRLRKAQLETALAGNPTMLIWLGKQMLNQRDEAEHSSKVDATCTVAITSSDGRSFVIKPNKAEADEFTSHT